MSRRCTIVKLSRKERDRQLRRDDILKAAGHLFAVKGYHKATICDIANEAQYAVGTIYLHFKNKDDIYFALLKEKIKHLLSIIIQKKAEQAGDAKTRLKLFVRESLAFFEENRDFFRIFSSEEDSPLIETKLIKSSVSKQLQEYVKALIIQAQKEQVISRDLDPKQVKDVLVAILKTVVLEWLNDNKAVDKHLVDLSDVILRYFLNGVGNKHRLPR